MARLLSVNVGLPRDIEWNGRTVHTGIWKAPVPGRCRVGRLNLDGDGQGDLAGHGGEQRAVFVYQIDSYRYWQAQLKRTDFVHGQFGENFTVEGLSDDVVCIGDRYEIGTALVEVTQPRTTCYRVGIRMNEPRMPALLTSSGRPGFYFRVLREGEVGAGDEIVKVGEAQERMTVAEISALLYSPSHPRERLQRALRIEALSPGWRSSFDALLESHAPGNAGLAPAGAAHPAAPGFRPLAVTALDHESADVLSLTMQSADGLPLPAALPGQYVVLRLQRGAGVPPLFRSYSLSGAVSTERYRISVKIEPSGSAGKYLHEQVRVGDVLDVSSPRGSFISTPLATYRSAECASPRRRLPIRASWSWRKRATCRSVGRAGRVFVTTVRAAWFLGRSFTDQSHSRSRPTATCSFAARNRAATSLLICESSLGALSAGRSWLVPCSRGNGWQRRERDVSRSRPDKRRLLEGSRQRRTLALATTGDDCVVAFGA